MGALKRSELAVFPCLQRERDGFVADAQDHGHRLNRAEAESGETALFPGEIHGQAATGADAGEGALVPDFWQGGQQVDNRATGGVALMALDEHFHDAGGGAEVTVNLEGRVGVEEVGVEAGTLAAAEFVGGADEVA